MMEEQNIEQKSRAERLREHGSMSVLARAMSNVFRPSYFPMLGFVLLLMFTYLSQLPWQFKAAILAMVYLFTLFLPAIGVYAFRRMRRLNVQQLTLHHNRLVPYVLHIICYGVLLRFLFSIHAPVFMGGIIVISLLVQCVCTVTTLWWKVSMHSAGVGAIMGALVAYSSIFHFNPVWWLCLALLVSGAVNSSRMYLRQHTLWQVLGGTLIGFACGLVGLFI